MITIIDKGQDPKEKPKIKKCPNCKTIFSYYEEDTHSDGDSTYVVCPVCKEFLNISK